MRLRIMHVVESLGKGGLENGVVNLITHLDSKYFEHVVLALRHLGPNVDRLPKGSVEVVCLGKTQRDSRVHTPALARAIRKFRPHVVHSRNWGAIEAVIAGRWTGRCGLVHSEHGFDSDTNTKDPRRRVLFRRLAFELADRVLSVSNQLRMVHAQRTGFSPDKITVIHNGVDCRRFRPDSATRARIRRELGIAESDFCIGCVGNLLPIKDHITLLRSVGGLAEAGVRFRLVIVGEGPELPRLLDYVRSHPESGHQVSFIGSSNRVQELLNAMDAYVLCSISEGLSNSLLEAMATALPVAATATGGNPEVVVHGKSGFLCPAGDFRQLSQLLLALQRQTELRKRLGQDARRHVEEHFSLGSMLLKYEQVYRSVAKAASAGDFLRS